jgi:RNA polymerase sigma factor (sigma-70 family)
MPFDPHDSHDQTIEALLEVSRRLARRWCANSADAEDAAQEAVVRLWSCSDPPRNAVTWLAVVTRRLCNRDRLRGEIRRRAEDVFNQTNALSHGGRLDLLLDLDRVLDQLPERDRRLLQYVTEGYQTREIASVLNCAPGDVGQMVSRARAKARRLRDRLRCEPSETAGRTAPRGGPDKNQEGGCSHPTRDPTRNRK